MTSLPGHTGAVLFWRLDDKRFEKTWDSGEGARHRGGRWSPPGVPAVYCSLDPGTAILEVAVHKGFGTLNAVPHVLSAVRLDISWDRVPIVRPEDIPYKLWRYPCASSAAQQEFGNRWLKTHGFLAIPSAVSRRSWNLIFDANRSVGKYTLQGQEDLDLDPRLDPPGRSR
jgi:RES domain-containing protein